MAPTHTDVITRKLINTRNSIKRKFRRLQDTKHMVSTTAGEQFKSVSEPLKMLMEHVRDPTTAAAIKQEIKDEVIVQPKTRQSSTPFRHTAAAAAAAAAAAPSPLAQSTPTAYNVETIPDWKQSHITPVMRPINKSLDDSSELFEVEGDEEEEETVPELNAGPEDHFNAEPSVLPPQFLERGYTSLFKEKLGDTVGEYVKYLHDPQNVPKIDTTYGLTVKKDGLGIVMGNKPVLFDNDEIIIDNVRYAGTRGLMELLTKKFPQKEYYDNEQDLDAYKRILRQTKVHMKTNGQIKSNQGSKYREIIKRLFPNLKSTSAQNFSALSLSKMRKGEGYKFWNNPNELVNRLRLLTASQMAGNHSHRNEIISIIEELREENIIS